MVSRDVQLVGIVVAVALLQLACVYLYFGPAIETEASPEVRVPQVEAKNAREEKPAEQHVKYRSKNAPTGVRELPVLDATEEYPYNYVSGAVLAFDATQASAGKVVNLQDFAFQSSRESIDLLQGGILGQSSTGSRSVRRLVHADAEIGPVCLYNRLPEEAEHVTTSSNPLTGEELEFAHFGPQVTGYGVELKDWGMVEPNKFASGMRIIKEYKSHGKNVVYIDTGATLGFLSLWFAAAGADVYAFEPLHKHARKVCNSILLNGMQDKIALFNVAPYNVDEEQAWCTPLSHYGLRYAEISCPQSSEDPWFSHYDYEFFRLRDADFLFRDTLRHVFDQPEGAHFIIIRVVFDYAEELLHKLEALIEGDKNVKHIWVSSNMKTWKHLSGVQFVHDMRGKGFMLVDEYCQEFLEPSEKTLRLTNEFLFTRDPLACGLDPAGMQAKGQKTQL